MKTIPIRLRFEFEEDEEDHCKKHRKAMKAASCVEYVRMASQFITKPLSSTMRECIRPGGDRLRYDWQSNEFAVSSPESYIRTYFRLDPLIHELATNMAYFDYECGER